MMKNIFLTADRKTLQVVQDLGRQADAQGLKAWVVGGYVRDLILKRPSQDLDIVVEGNAIEFARRVASKKSLKVKAHPRFGTAVVLGWADGRHVDCVSARSEIYPAPGDLPVVKHSGINEDLERRDFTINAMAAGLNRREFGILYDPFRGGEDLRRGVIRIFHDKSFVDDPTRLLRAVRFEQRFGFRFSRRTGNLMRAAIDRRAYCQVSGVRFFREFVRGLMEKSPGRYIRRLKRMGLLEFLAVDRMPASSVFDRLDDLCSRQEVSPESRRQLYLSALYGESGDAAIDHASRVFQWQRRDRKQLAAFIETIRTVRRLKNRRAIARIYRETFGSCPKDIMVLIQAVGALV